MDPREKWVSLALLVSQVNVDLVVNLVLKVLSVSLESAVKLDLVVSLVKMVPLVPRELWATVVHLV